jgi:UTP--glucose-1-phosphate uridylyltransferase
MRVVIPAAGAGTRFLPQTRAMPKEMLPIVSKPVIEYVVEEAIASGAKDILIVTGYAKRAIEDHFDLGEDLGARIHYIRQKHPQGLGAAIALAQSFTDGEPFGVLLGDTIHECSRPILSQLRKATVSGATCVAVEKVPDDKVKDYGIVEGPEVDGVVRCTDLIEKPALSATSSRLGLTGAYLLTPDIYGALRHTTPGANGEIQLTDALRVLAHERAVYASRFEGVRYDIGDPAGWLRTNLEFAKRDPALREKLKETVEAWARTA